MTHKKFELPSKVWTCGSPNTEQTLLSVVNPSILVTTLKDFLLGTCSGHRYTLAVYLPALLTVIDKL